MIKTFLSCCCVYFTHLKLTSRYILTVWWFMLVCSGVLSRWFISCNASHQNHGGRLLVSCEYDIESWLFPFTFIRTWKEKISIYWYKLNWHISMDLFPAVLYYQLFEVMGNEHREKQIRNIHGNLSIHERLAILMKWIVLSPSIHVLIIKILK